MKKENRNLNADLACDLEADRRYRAAVVGALADRAGSFASRLTSEGLDDNSIRTLAQEVVTLQNALPRALMELNNAAVAEYDARR